MGGCFLLLGLLVINGGPQHLLTDIGDVLLKYVANKTISSAVAAFISLILYRLFEKSWSLLVFINGAMAHGKETEEISCVTYMYLFIVSITVFNHLNWRGPKIVLVF